MSDWISVEDRLPDSEGYYLVYSPAYYGVRGMDYIREAHGFVWYTDENSPTSGNTHWMPLPEPPEDQ